MMPRASHRLVGSLSRYPEIIIDPLHSPLLSFNVSEKAKTLNLRGVECEFCRLGQVLLSVVSGQLTTDHRQLTTD